MSGDEFTKWPSRFQKPDDQDRTLRIPGWRRGKQPFPRPAGGKFPTLEELLDRKRKRLDKEARKA